MTAHAPSPNSDRSQKARYIMVGGFLGAGKTTAISRLAQQITAQGLRVGLITNDQGSGLVDTAFLRSRGFSTEEIAGGCFCCRFRSLLEAANRLTEASQPDIFIGEPVGSCTDLTATVSYPLRRMYGTQFEIAPLTVLVDPVRAQRIFGLVEGAGFSEKVVYIYRKQLEEADIIAINKADTLDVKAAASLQAELQSSFPRAMVLLMSARTGAGLDAWFEQVLKGNAGTRDAMDVDYDLYASGEELLGWLNATISQLSDHPVDANEMLVELGRSLQVQLQNAGAEVAHLKMTLSPRGGLGELAMANLVRNDFVPELGQWLDEPVSESDLIINLRAEAPPEELHRALLNAMANLRTLMPATRLEIEHVEHFRPGRPTPTHRMTTFI